MMKYYDGKRLKYTKTSMDKIGQVNVLIKGKKLK